MQPLSVAHLRPLLLTLGLGLFAAAVCIRLDTPLPWIIGPLFFTAAARMAGIDLYCPIAIRQAGQWVIGTVLGLYFTSPVLKALATYIGYIAVGVVFAMLLGAVCGWLLHRLSGIGRTTAFFAMAVGGASEMVTQGERYGAAADRVAAAHSLRIMMVVGVIPFAFKFWGVHGEDAYTVGARIVDHGGLALLILLTSACALGLTRLNWPNAWVIGPLSMAIGLTASGIHLSALPEWMVHFGQLFIGVSLGTQFTPAFLHTAPRYLMSVTACSATALLLAAGFGYGLGIVSGIDPATVILATSPGGIAEMSLTAKTLHLGVPVVTAFHVTRMTVLVLTIGPLFRFMQRLRKKTQPVQP